MALFDFGNIVADKTFMRRDFAAFPSWTTDYLAVVKRGPRTWDIGQRRYARLAAAVSRRLGAPTDDNPGQTRRDVGDIQQRHVRSRPTCANIPAMVPDLARLVAFAATAFVVIAIPGPSVLFVISRGVAFGRRVALTTVLGNEAGLFLQVLTVALGLGALVERSIAVFTILKLAGAAYLVFLGVQAIRHRRSLADALGLQPVGAGRQVFRQGFVVGLSNPKSIILFAAILPQFVNRTGDAPVQMLVLGIVAVSIALLCDSAWALMAGGVRSWFRRSPRSLALTRGAGGIVMIGLGIRLAIAHRND